MTLQQEKIRAARLSIASNSLLILFKLIVGLSIGAVSILSEAIHSAVDLVAAVIAYLSGEAFDATFSTNQAAPSGADEQDAAGTPDAAT